MHIELPTQAGAYRWYYFDVDAGEHTAVCIFMIGSIFSARYSARLARGALPVEHSSVNFALYRRGVRQLWVLSEYPTASVENEGQTLRIGQSVLRYMPDGRVEISIRDRSMPWRSVVDAQLSFEPSPATSGPLQLIDGLSHHWHPIAPRGMGTVTLPTLTMRGRGYHDGNFGEVALGTDCPGWEWSRLHFSDRTEVRYRPYSRGAGLRLVARDSTTVTTVREALEPLETTRTRWGLEVPAKTRLLESSPFYARHETETPNGTVLGEVADFARFHRPSIRWMASLRTRLGQRA